MSDEKEDRAKGEREKLKNTKELRAEEPMKGVLHLS
jgi:hypothetical protein